VVGDFADRDGGRIEGAKCDEVGDDTCEAGVLEQLDQLAWLLGQPLDQLAESLLLD